MHFLNQPPRYLFFTGKGGVGKTSIACATAVQLAAEGKRVLLVSTDPASNVGQVFGESIGNHITAIPAVPNLSALEIDPQAAAQAYRDRIVGPVRGVLPEPVVKGIEEQLSGACTTEIAAFDEFTALLIDSALTADYEHIIFDTAPTGHTIRLLQLPGAWSGFLEEGKGDASCLGPLAGLEKQRTQYKAAVEALADPLRTRLVLVARAQRATLREVARTHEELASIGLSQQYLVINGVLPISEAEHDELAQSILLCPDAAYIDRVVASIDKLLPTMPRQAVIRASLENRGALIAVRDLDEACAIANRIAPEHLELSLADADAWVAKIQHAGAIFIGPNTSESLGDYCAGPNHVLPTSGSARFSSPLGVYDFQKRSSLIRISPAAAKTLGRIASTLAKGEGLAAHARSADYRVGAD
jgi:TRC40/GET3/ArsA family transport-energizing ATPase